MPAVTSYSEASLAIYMVAELSATGRALGLTVASDEIVKAVGDSERLLGVSDVATATDMPLVEAAARWQAWRAAEAASTNDKTLKAGAESINLSERFEHIRARLDDAYGFYLIEKARVANATGTGVFAFGLAPGRRGR